MCPVSCKLLVKNLSQLKPFQRNRFWNSKFDPTSATYSHMQRIQESYDPSPALPTANNTKRVKLKPSRFASSRGSSSSSQSGGTGPSRPMQVFITQITLHQVSCDCVCGVMVISLFATHTGRSDHPGRYQSLAE